MARYVYPAVFVPEEAGGYSVNFPDLEGCFTQGEDLAEGLEMARDVLSLVLMGLEDEGKVIPPASRQQDVQLEDDQFALLVSCDTTEYRKLYGSELVEKTVQLPLWLNTLAERADLDLSAVLREALRKKLDRE